VIGRVPRCAALLVLAMAEAAAAGQVQAPPLPLAPEVISRDADRQATVRAIKLDQPLTLDGRLDDAVYARERSISDFIQTLPGNNTVPSERTEAWIMFDSEALYVAGRCWDSAPPEQWIANELRRDQGQIRQNDHFGVMLDTFYDRRNGYVFYANPLGGRMDLTEADESNSNSDWNPVWNVRTGRFAGGWTIEMRIPFRSLRYTSGVDQKWGLQIRRSIRRKNEWVHLTPLPIAMGGPQGFFRISAAATLAGLDLPPASRNIELKPYGITRTTTDRLANPPVSNDVEPDWGVDGKYGITANLTADITYNTDFAQVEVDEQQVNLTRFSIQFPEKRDFFLEGRGIFAFASFPTTQGGASTANTPVLFYSRRIGLEQGPRGPLVVPIDVGERLTGKVGRLSIGAINIQTGAEELRSGAVTAVVPSTNFSVLRLKQDVLRRSNFGVMLTNRSRSVTDPEGSNQTYGGDAVFSFFNSLSLGGYYGKTQTDNKPDEDDSYQARAEFSPDRYGAQFEYLKVGRNFNPEVGFVRRLDMKRTFGLLRFSPRPRSIPSIRQITMTGSVEYISNVAGQLETRQQNAYFNIERQNSDQMSVEANVNYELIREPFSVGGGVRVPAGSYDFSDVTFRYAFGQQRPASGAVTWQVGQFYDGNISALGVSGARVAVTKQFSVEPSLSLNHLTLPVNQVTLAPADFTTTVARVRSDYAFTNRMFASTLLQYSSNDRSFSSNLRFRWEYILGSELFVVYTDERDTTRPGYPELRNRAFVVKINRMWRF
jgi:hypothetical protein